MKRSNTTNAVNHTVTSSTNKNENFLKVNIDSLTKSANQLSLSSTTLNEKDGTIEDCSDEKLKKNLSYNSIPYECNNNTPLTKESKEEEKSQSKFKLVSPYGDWCAFS
jgi:hypothetical protein